MATGTITQRISLEGGDQIKAQLEAIGKAGSDAFKRFQDAAGASATVNQFGATLETFRQKIQAVSDAGASLGTKFGDLGQRAAETAKRIGIAGGLITGAVAGFVALVKKSGEATDQLRETAQT